MRMGIDMLSKVINGKEVFFDEDNCFIHSYKKGKQYRSYGKVLHCSICGNLVFRKHSKIHNHVLCSKKCEAKFNSIKIKGDKNPNYKGGDIECVCGYCGKKFYRQLSNTNENNNFCCVACWGKYNSIRQIGINNPSWKGGITPLSIKIRCLGLYYKWKTQILIRDDFKCQCCGKSEDGLHVHHIYGFSDIVSQFNIKTVEDAKQCKELWDINNGVTLCFDCHMRLHFGDNK